jgi:PAS domain S-box-containing protein
MSATSASPSASPEWWFRTIVEDVPDAVIAADPDGHIRLWNKGAETVFGFTAAEALGQSLDLIIPERFRERHWTGYRSVMQSGTSRYGTQLLAVPATRKDGARISIEFHVVVLKDPSTGGVSGIAAIVRDVTERWERERALRAQLQSQPQP